MPIKINFDSTHNPETPTLVLAKRSGIKMGALDAHGIVLKGAMTEACEIQFDVYKYQSDGETLTNLWYSIIDFRLIWCKEWDMWFELTVELDETTETRKTVYCTQLGDAELSQIMLYDIHINDEADIAREDYTEPTVLYNPNNPDVSLLDRITEHAPHYRISHVDSTIANIQRTFTFDSESIRDAFNEIAEEIECIFILPSNSDDDGKIDRTIEVYDLDANCNICGHRGDFTGTCPECGSNNINEGYGEDTTIFISAEELASEIQLGTDTDAVKNCFKLEGGDDLMTATIRNCNPNGSDRIWYITAQAQADMSAELLDGLAGYNERYAYYQDEYVANIPSEMLTSYNELVTKYREYSEDIEYMPSQITGYPALMEAYYNTVDFALYLQSVLMPDASMSDTTAEIEAAKLTAKEFGTVAVADVSSLSTSSANNAVLAMAKVIVDARYQVKVNEGEFGAGQQWTGDFKVTNYSDDDDTAISDTITLTISDDYEEYLRQMIEKELNADDVNDLSITALFEMDYDDFCAELKKYCLDSLNSFWDAGQACLDILIEQGIADKETWGSDAAGADSNLYEKLYLPYYDKQAAIESEIKVREDEIAIILGTYDENGYVDMEGLQSYIIDERNMIQSMLDFESYLGEDLWLEFSAFRREDKYSNSNYISDGLNNAKLFARAWEFFEVAQEEIYKSAELQHSISTSLKNLLVIDKFAPLVDYFECGNWLRVRTDDSIYKLRLIKYEIDYDSIEKLSVDFSDVMKTLDGLSDKQSLISKMTSMASSYDSVEHQASQGSKSYEATSGWSTYGLDVTNTKLIQGAEDETQSWDSHGMLFRKYDPITETYYDEQLKIIHSTMVITDDNWKTVRTAVGGFYYYDPADGETKYAYGINGEVLVGQLILGEQLGIYNDSGTLTFDANGFTITNGVNTFTLNPNSGSLLVLSNANSQILYVNSSGDAFFEGSITSSGGNIAGWTISLGALYGQFATQEYEEIEQQARDDDGTLLYEEQQSVDSSGNPVYTTTTEYIRDVDGNILYGSDGNALTTTVETPVMTQVPVMEIVEVPVAGKYYDNYTLLSTDKNSGDISIAVGATKLGSDGVPDKDSASIQLYNTGKVTTKAISANGAITAKSTNDVIKASSSGTSGDTRITVQSWSEHKVWLGVGSGGDNRGIYDASSGGGRNSWIIYNNASNNTVIPAATTVNGLLTLKQGLALKGGTTLSGRVTVTGSYIDVQTMGIALANAYGVYHYLANGSSFVRSEYFDSSDRLNLGNSSYITILRGSSVYLNGTSTAVTSDLKLKTGVQLLNKNDSALFDNLIPRQYEVAASPGKIHVGFVAQEVENAMAKAGLNPDDYGLTESFEDEGETLMAIRYEEIIPMLVYEVQQLKEKVRDLENG